MLSTALDDSRKRSRREISSNSLSSCNEDFNVKGANQPKLQQLSILPHPDGRPQSVVEGTGLDSVRGVGIGATTNIWSVLYHRFHLKSASVRRGSSSTSNPILSSDGRS